MVCGWHAAHSLNRMNECIEWVFVFIRSIGSRNTFSLVDLFAHLIFISSPHSHIKSCAHMSTLCFSCMCYVCDRWWLSLSVSFSHIWFPILRLNYLIHKHTHEDMHGECCVFINDIHWTHTCTNRPVSFKCLRMYETFLLLTTALIRYTLSSFIVLIYSRIHKFQVISIETNNYNSNNRQ